MKKWLEFLIPVKTAACYSFTASLSIYTLIRLFAGQTSIPLGLALSFLLLSLAAAALQIVAFTPWSSKSCATDSGCCCLSCHSLPCSP